MVFLLLLCCHLHNASLAGIVDRINYNQCMIEIAEGDIVTVESKLCQHVSEGEKVLFYIKKERR